MVIGLIEIILDFKDINNDVFEKMNKTEVIKYSLGYLFLISLMG